jgi:integrase
MRNVIPKPIQLRKSSKSASNFSMNPAPPSGTQIRCRRSCYEVVIEPRELVLKPRTIELLRHMMNWAVGREYLERTPFRRGTETLIRKQHEDNRRRRRISEDEESNLLAVAEPFLRSMIIAALDTGMRQGEMLALRFADIDEKRQLIVLRGATTKRARRRESCRSPRHGSEPSWTGYVSTQLGRRSRERPWSSATKQGSRSADSEPRGSPPS